MSQYLKTGSGGVHVITNQRACYSSSPASIISPGFSGF